MEGEWETRQQLIQSSLNYALNIITRRANHNNFSKLKREQKCQFTKEQF